MLLPVLLERAGLSLLAGGAEHGSGAAHLLGNWELALRVEDVQAGCQAAFTAMPVGVTDSYESSVRSTAAALLFEVFASEQFEQRQH